MTDRRTLAALFAGISRSGVTMISGLDQREQSLVVGGPRQLEHGAGQRVWAAPGVAGCEGQHRPVDRVRAVGQQRLLLVHGGIVPVVARRWPRGARTVAPTTPARGRMSITVMPPPAGAIGVHSATAARTR